MLPGEVVGKASVVCGCRRELKLQILRTSAFYIGFCCPMCGPYSRESGYYKTKQEAEAALSSGSYLRE